MIDSHDFGYVAGTTPEKVALTGTYTPAATGLYTLEIQNSRKLASSADLHNYMDTVVLEPLNWMLGSDGVTISAIYGGTRTFYLQGGGQYANSDYWMWVGVSGTYPGMQTKGVEIPLNYDFLVGLCWLAPGGIGTGFVGKLDGTGDATAAMTLLPDTSLIDLTLYYSYVILSPGMSLPVLAASNPVNVTVTALE